MPESISRSRCRTARQDHQAHPAGRDRPAHLPGGGGPEELGLAEKSPIGLLAIFFAPDHTASTIEPRPWPAASRAGAPDNPMAGFDVVATVPVLVTDDLEAGYAVVAPYAALYVGGMGSREQNFTTTNWRLGWGSGRLRPRSGPLPRRSPPGCGRCGAPAGHRRHQHHRPCLHVASRLRAYADAGVTTLAVALHL